MKTTLKIHRESLANVIRDLIEEDVRKVDPCLVYDSETGYFSIESKHTHRDENEHVIADRICETFLESNAAEVRSEIEEAVEETKTKMTEQAVTEAMSGMDDDYIAEYIVGDLDVIEE